MTQIKVHVPIMKGKLAVDHVKATWHAVSADMMHKSSSRPYMISPKLQLSNLASVFQMVIKESLGTTHVMDQWPV